MIGPIDSRGSSMTLTDQRALRRIGLRSVQSAGPDVLMLLALALLCAILPVLFAGEHASRLSPLALVGQWVVVAYAGTHLALLLRRGAPVWFDTIFWSFAYCWVGLAGWAQMTALDNPYHVVVSVPTYERVVLLTLVGFFSYDVGKLLLRPKTLPEANPQGRVVSPRRTLAFAATAILVTPALVTLGGGLGAVLSSRSERTAGLAASGLLTDESKVAGGLLIPFTIALPLVAFLAVLAVVQYQGGLLRRPLWIGLLMVLGSFALVVGNPISNPRFWTGTVVLSVLFSLTWPNTARGYRATLGMVLLGLLVVFPYADRYRYAGQVSESRSLGDLFVTKLDYDSAVQMANVIDFVDRAGGTAGQQVLGVIGFFVPRSMWPGKPGATGSLLTEYVGFPQSNVSSPLWVEAYIDGGLFAVMLTFLALSIGATYAQRLRGRQQGRPISWAMLLTPLVSAYSVVLLRGSLLSGIGALTVLVLLTWLVTRRARLEVRATAPAAAVALGHAVRSEPRGPRRNVQGG